MRRLAWITLISWLGMVGVDFFLHAGLLASLYVQESEFLLPPTQAFRLIPLGYLSFLVLAVLLIWLMSRLEVAGGWAGFAFGLKLGGLAWGAFALGLLSISTVGVSLALGWFLGQSLELAVGGGIAGLGMAGKRLGLLLLGVLGLDFVLVVLTIVLQNTGLAPAVQLR